MDDTNEMTIDDNGWYHISFNQNGSSVVSRLNNAVMSPAFGGGYDIDRGKWINDFVVPLSSITIAKSGALMINLKIDDLRYYSQSLTDAQLNFIYNSGNGTESELI